MNEAVNKLDTIKNLKRKAEICRFSHSKLKAYHEACARTKTVVTLSLSAILTVVIGLYFRKYFTGDIVQIVMFILPIIIGLWESLDHVCFRWADNAKQHENAVSVWGAWSRKANSFIEISKGQDSVDENKIKALEKQYRKCMDRTPQIPNKKFLKYKCEHYLIIEKAKELDKLSRDDLAKFKSQKRWRI